MERYNLLLNYKNKYGNVNIPVNFKTKDGINESNDPNAINLYAWLHQQKQNYNNNSKSDNELGKRAVRLKSERITLLENIGINLSTKKSQYNPKLHEYRLMVEKIGRLVKQTEPKIKLEDGTEIETVFSGGTQMNNYWYNNKDTIQKIAENKDHPNNEDAKVILEIANKQESHKRKKPIEMHNLKVSEKANKNKIA